MLQQTQVSRVVPAFERFIQRFPTVGDLAAAPLDDVLGMWSGLGYYRRARHLHAAAQTIVRKHGGRVPDDAATLRSLPGVGRYTAGSIASIVFARREPILDGNVRRVMLRVHGQDLDPASKPTDVWAWKAADHAVQACSDPAAFNEGLMELGAIVCLPPPAKPRCDACPLADACVARRDGTAERIPRAKKPAKPTDVYFTSLLIRDRSDRIMLEKRPDRGMWAGLWQLPTLETVDAWPAPQTIADFAAMRAGSIRPDTPPAAEFTHQTTHRTVRIRVYVAMPTTCLRKSGTRTWATTDQLRTLGISNATTKSLRLSQQAIQTPLLDRMTSRSLLH